MAHFLMKTSLKLYYIFNVLLAYLFHNILVLLLLLLSFKTNVLAGSQPFLLQTRLLHFVKIDC